MSDFADNQSPKWSSTTKLVVSLSGVALAAVFFARFNNLIGPVLLSFVLAYLFYPSADFLRRKIKLSWRLSSTIVFLLIFLILLGLLTWGGFALFGQITSLIGFVEREIGNLPQYIADLSQQKFLIGPFVVDFTQIDLVEISNQILDVIRPVLSKLGSGVGSAATSAASTLGMFFFTLLIAYFILAESSGARSDLVKINIPGYEFDIKRMSDELKRIWNAFLRGQIIIILITIVIYTVLLGSLRVEFFFGLAVVAGLARFVPYVGPVVAWTLYGLVTLFQGSTIFGLEPIIYAIMVIVIAWLTDVILDNFMVGLLGVMLAGPVLATAKLFGRYIFYKMLDIDPWKDFVAKPPKLRMSPDWFDRYFKRFSPRQKRIAAWFKDREKEIDDKDKTHIDLKEIKGDKNGK